MSLIVIVMLCVDSLGVLLVGLVVLAVLSYLLLYHSCSHTYLYRFLKVLFIDTAKYFLLPNKKPPVFLLGACLLLLNLSGG